MKGLVKRKKREIVVRGFSKTLNIENAEVVNIIQQAGDALTNQNFGGIPLKHLALVNDLNSKDAFEYCRKRGYLEQTPRGEVISTYHMCKWMGFKSNKGKRRFTHPENNLMIFKSGTLFINTNSDRFDKFVKELRKNCRNGYNAKIKASDFIPDYYELHVLKQDKHKHKHGYN